MDDKKLMECALKMRDMSYCPYSGFSVGAALLTESGKIYTGCNIENAGFSSTNCAERTAFFKAVSEGEKKFKKIAIAGGKKGASPTEYTYPCGVCRQVMKEFCNDSFEIISVITTEDFTKKTLGELFPFGFGPDNL